MTNPPDPITTPEAALEAASQIAVEWCAENKASAARARKSRSEGSRNMAEMLDGAAIECNAIAVAILGLRSRIPPAVEGGEVVDEALRDAVKPFERLAQWATGTYKTATSDRKLVDAPGMLRAAPDDYIMRDQQLSPDEPRLRLGHFRALLAALARRTSPQPPEQVPTASSEYTDEALAAAHIDFLDRKADAWMEELSVRQMMNAIASVFERHASQEIMDRFREKLFALMHQAFVEGALRAWSEISAERQDCAAQPPEQVVEAMARAIEQAWSSGSPETETLPPIEFSPDESMALARAAYAAIPLAPGEDGWLPIESAPKDGTDVLLWVIHPNAQYAGTVAERSDWQGPVVARWIDHNGGGWTWHGITGRFTHWRPLPTPPAGEGARSS